MLVFLSAWGQGAQARRDGKDRLGNSTDGTSPLPPPASRSLNRSAPHSDIASTMPVDLLRRAGGHAALCELNAVIHRVHLEDALGDVDAARQGVDRHQGIVVVPVPASPVHLDEPLGRCGSVWRAWRQRGRVLHGVDGRLSDDGNDCVDRIKLGGESGHICPSVFYVTTGCEKMRDLWIKFWPLLTMCAISIYLFRILYVANNTGTINNGRLGMTDKKNNPFDFWFNFLVHALGLFAFTIMEILYFLATTT